MPIDNTLQVRAGRFPAGYCPRSNQQLADDIAAGLTVTFTGSFATVTSATVPEVKYQDAVWIRTDETTGAVLGLYTFSTTYNVWISYHWPKNFIPTREKKLFVGNLAQLEVFDGGEAGAVTATTGPFWEVDTLWNDKFPLGVGVTIATPGTDADVFDDATPGAPQGRGVYFIKPTARIFDRVDPA